MQGLSNCSRISNDSSRVRRSELSSGRSLGGKEFLRSGLCTPAILAAVVAIGLMLWSIPARVQVELTTERMEFEVAASEQGKTMLGGFDVQSVAIEKFSTLAFEPVTIEVANPLQYWVKTDDFPPSAWKRLKVDGYKVTLGAKDQTRPPRVTVEGLNAAESETIHLDPMAVAPGTHVTLAAREIHGGRSRD